jgi:hypothetical protein
MGLNHSPAIVTNGLVLCVDPNNVKSFTSNTNSWIDLSTTGNNGTFNGNPYFSTANNNSITFNGSTSYVDFGTSNTLNFSTGFSASFWINANGTFYNTNTLMYYLNRWTYSGGNYRQWSFDTGATANYIEFRATTNGLDSGATGVGAPLTYSDTWINICGTWDGYLMKLYSNASQIGGTAALPFMFQTPSQHTYFGGGNQGTVYPFSGSLGPVQIYNRGLTQDEVSQNFNAIRGRYGL